MEMLFDERYINLSEIRFEIMKVFAGYLTKNQSRGLGTFIKLSRDPQCFRNRIVK